MYRAVKLNWFCWEMFVFILRCLTLFSEFAIVTNRSTIWDTEIFLKRYRGVTSDIAFFLLWRNVWDLIGVICSFVPSPLWETELFSSRSQNVDKSKRLLMWSRHTRNHLIVMCHKIVINVQSGEIQQATSIQGFCCQRSHHHSNRRGVAGMMWVESIHERCGWRRRREN